MLHDTSKEIGLTISASLAERLRKSIREGAYQPGDMIGSEYELARQESISRMTVRRASEILVKEGLLERRPGKGLYVRSCGVVAKQHVQVIVGNLQWEWCRQVARGVQLAARAEGIQVQLYDAHGDAELDVEVVRQLPGSAIGGAVIVSLHAPAFNEAVYELKRKGFPFVLVDQRLHDIEVPSVEADNYSGGLQIGQELIAKGHKRVGFIGDLEANTVRDRLEGLRDALGDAGVAFDRKLIGDLVSRGDRLGDWSVRVEERVKEIMSQPNPPTALFCSCDAVARSTYMALQGLGLNVPTDVSVAGYDDDPIAELVTPGLTTVRQSFLEMGRSAIDLLCKRMVDSHAEVEHRVLPVEIVRRASVATAKTSAKVMS